jgi:hypothetical protein
MKAYIARLKADQSRPREVVGFFFAEDMGQLYPLIDECCDVQCCEVMELGPGGIFWNDAVDYVVPIEPSEDALGLPGGATMTESWMASLCSEGQWLPLASDVWDHANDS